jgi:hypothetical protein
MARYVRPLAGVLLVALALIAGVAVGRVIEAIAVAAMLIAGWTYLRRLAA